jgi:hypothetical protein
MQIHCQRRWLAARLHLVETTHVRQFLTSLTSHSPAGVPSNDIDASIWCHYQNGNGAALAANVIGYECQNAHNRCSSLYRVRQLHAWSPFELRDARFSRLAAVSALVKRFMAAMINTSSSVNPRVVIFHMIASQLVRSIAPLCKARVVPNAVAHVSDGKRWD